MYDINKVFNFILSQIYSRLITQTDKLIDKFDNVTSRDKYHSNIFTERVHTNFFILFDITFDVPNDLFINQDRRPCNRSINMKHINISARTKMKYFLITRGFRMEFKVCKTYTPCSAIKGPKMKNVNQFKLENIRPDMMYNNKRQPLNYMPLTRNRHVHNGG